MMKHRANGAYDFPGGRIEWGETPEEALRRELMEELTYATPAPPKFLEIWNYIAKDNSRHSVFLYYFLEVDEEPKFTITEDADGLWLDKSFFLEKFKDPKRVGNMFSLSPVKE
jgi:ADP-ribose pyrophosphatase YjhB (NUDIX family)